MAALDTLQAPVNAVPVRGHAPRSRHIKLSEVPLCWDLLCCHLSWDKPDSKRGVLHSVGHLTSTGYLEQVDSDLQAVSVRLFCRLGSHSVACTDWLCPQLLLYVVLLWPCPGPAMPGQGHLPLADPLWCSGLTGPSHNHPIAQDAGAAARPRWAPRFWQDSAS